MLILSRRKDQVIRIGNDIQVMVIAVQGKYVRIGIDAPKDMRVIRQEIEEPRPQKSEG